MLVHLPASAEGRTVRLDPAGDGVEDSRGLALGPFGIQPNGLFAEVLADGFHPARDGGLVLDDEFELVGARQAVGQGSLLPLGADSDPGEVTAQGEGTAGFQMSR